MVRIPKDELQEMVTQIFLKVGLDAGQASTIARHLVLANLRGVDSHGVSRVPIYVQRLEKGLTNKGNHVEIERESGAFALLDAQNISGITAATKGIELAIAKAKETGVGLVGIKNSNHCGMLADYTSQAAENDCIALATTNAPANMAPWGGRERFFGTNPFSYGIPAGQEPNIIFDMATSVVAKGKIINAQKNQQSIPIGWAISKEGKPTTDPNEAVEGLVLPVGGPKGYGLAMLVDILSGLYTGACYGPHIGDLYTDFEKNQNVGQFFIVMRADLYQPLQQFKDRMDTMIREIRRIPLVEGTAKIYLPGEIEQQTLTDRLNEGIPLSMHILNDLLEVANAYQIKNTMLSNIN
jgi:LDH2 family malate/lactate/ureidoglycolate dehydrogenase